MREVLRATFCTLKPCTSSAHASLAHAAKRTLGEASIVMKATTYPLLVVGSIAIDSIESPHGHAPEILGGSATHFSLTASLFTPLRLVGVVGRDFPEAYVDVFRERQICLDGLMREEGKSFRWHGRYTGSMASAETLSVELNVFGAFKPEVPESYKDTAFVFLANGSPHLQHNVLEQCPNAGFTMLDTMNLWIETERRALERLLVHVDALVINDSELRELTETQNLVAAGHRALSMGPKTVIVKKGEHGALVFHGGDVFAVPAFPVEHVCDPTGAGDTFAAGVMGVLARFGSLQPSADQLKLAVCAGVVCASFNVEDFGANRIRRIGSDEVRERFRLYMRMLDVAGELPLHEIGVAEVG